MSTAATSLLSIPVISAPSLPVGQGTLLPPGQLPPGIPPPPVAVPGVNAPPLTPAPSTPTPSSTTSSAPTSASGNCAWYDLTCLVPNAFNRFATTNPSAINSAVANAASQPISFSRVGAFLLGLLFIFGGIYLFKPAISISPGPIGRRIFN